MPRFLSLFVVVRGESRGVSSGTPTYTDESGVFEHAKFVSRSDAPVLTRMRLVAEKNRARGKKTNNNGKTKWKEEKGKTMDAIRRCRDGLAAFPFDS